MAQPAALPTYRTAANVLEGQNGSGLRLAGWTVARMFMIGPPMMLVGVPTKQAFLGAGIASGLISIFTMLRIFDATHTGLAGVNSRRGGRRALGRAKRPTRK
jgi:hypothetical protein